MHTIFKKLKKKKGSFWEEDGRPFRNRCQSPDSGTSRLGCRVALAPSPWGFLGLFRRCLIVTAGESDWDPFLGVCVTIYRSLRIKVAHSSARRRLGRKSPGETELPLKIWWEKYRRACAHAGGGEGKSPQRQPALPLWTWPALIPAWMHVCTYPRLPFQEPVQSQATRWPSSGLALNMCSPWPWTHADTPVDHRERSLYTLPFWGPISLKVAVSGAHSDQCVLILEGWLWTLPTQHQLCTMTETVPQQKSVIMGSPRECPFSQGSAACR